MIYMYLSNQLFTKRFILMRKLTSNEISNVSGAGIFSDAGKEVGSAIGGLFDSISKAVTGHAPDQSFASVTGEIGEAFGSALDNNINTALTGIQQNLNNLISAIHDIGNKPASK